MLSHNRGGSQRRSARGGFFGLLAAMAIFAIGMLLPSGASAFGFLSFDAPVLDSAGTPETRAGVVTDRVRNAMMFTTTTNTAGNTTIDGGLKYVKVDLPPGMVGNPQVVEKCDPSKVAQFGANGCPASSQVGNITLHIMYPGGNAQNLTTPIYNIKTPPSAPAQFGFRGITLPVFMDAIVRPDDYGISIVMKNISQGLPIIGSTAEFWGVPAAKNGSGLIQKPFLINSTECSGGPVTTTVTASSWKQPNVFVTDSYDNPAMVGCEKLPFEPKLSLQPENDVAGAPSGYHVELAIPQHDDPSSLVNSHLRKAEVTLPVGVSVSPSAADGLATCSEEQIGLGTDSEVECPSASKIGSVKIETPLLEKPMQGAIYQADQDRNPFGTTLAIYLVPEGSGVTLKLPGKIAPDPVTGQLKTTFDDNPQLPFSKLTLDFNGGPRAPLTNPATCGIKTTEATMTPWSGTDPVRVVDSFEIVSGPGGAPCASTFEPGFRAGTTNPSAGDSSAFTMAVSLGSSTKELKSITSLRLPEGLLGRVASVPLCEESQAAAGSCPEASRIGAVQTAVGASSNPLWVPQAGKEPTGVYLTGPYKGAPYGLSIKVPAQAGPFDLGRVVVRSALHIDERTTAITTGIDESRVIDRNGTVTEVLPEALPRILKGIVLNQREIRVIMDREDFMVNPTDCSPKEITAEIGSYGGDRVAVGNRFRAVECAQLGFAPKFRAKILDKGRKSTLRSWHPRTRFAVVPRKGDANIGGARVVLPSSTLLDQANIGTTCTRVQMAERNCPEASIVGYARAWSPLLRKAVEGPVYLAANGGVRPLPDLAAVMDGEIRVVLQGEISTRRGGGKARLQNTFRVVPDAPVSRFVLTMRGGKNRGLLVNSTDLCRTAERGVAVFTGQNGRSHRLRPRIATSYKACGKVRRQAARSAMR